MWYVNRSENQERDMDVVVMLTNGRFGVLEDCDKLELEGQMVECWVEEEEGFELATGEVERVL
jgi:hypothetical protein